MRRCFYFENTTKHSLVHLTSTPPLLTVPRAACTLWSVLNVLYGSPGQSVAEYRNEVNDE